MSFLDIEIDRTTSHCEKWNKYKNQDIIPAWVADMDFKAPQPVIDALLKRVEHGIFGYTGMDDETYKAVINFIKRHHNWEIKKEWIVWMDGVIPGINITCRMLEKEDEVVTTTPIYPHFVTATKNTNKTLIQITMKEIKNRWSIDFDELENKITPKSKLFILCNPYNPGGTVFSKDELKKLGNLCVKYDMLICSDEIHADLVINEQAKHIPIASINDEFAKRTITLMAPSKTFNIAGLQSSFAIIADKKLRVRFEKNLRGLGGGINLLAITATKTAYKDGDKWLSELKNYLRENLKLVENFVKNNKKLKMLSCDATYLAWIDCSKLDAKDPYELFLSHGVGLSEGERFGNNDFIRLNFGTTKKNLIQILNKMQKAIDSQ
ncbi:MAG: pyridoxal phosphate-dependent aminotransferase [Epsilonproteobacteria bacterium]|nr:pyridoxal phosphate-dependent aminotransferase [Campylobacterota bacterium]